MGVDDLMADLVQAVARRMSESRLPGSMLRERHHLDPWFKDECERRLSERPTSRVLRSSDFPGLGAIDVVMRQPAALIELKWSYELPGKVFEGVWDAIKLCVLSEDHDFDAVYLVTGASDSEWLASESAELFDDGTVDMLELWQRSLVPKRGPNNGATVGEDLVIGAKGNRPLRAHPRQAVRKVARVRVGNDYELRAVRITPATPRVDWPAVAVASARATTPGPAVGHSGERFTLPARVTQAWIERTAPALQVAAVPAFLKALRARGWSEDDLRQRVLPLLPGGTTVQADA